MGKPAIKQLSDKIGILTDNGITETSLSEAIKNDRIKLDDNTTQHGFLEQLKLKFVYGAKGDGITNDTTALQNAFNDGICFIPEGTFLFTPPLKINANNVKIYGVNRDKSILKPTLLGVNAIEVAQESNVTNLEFKDWTLFGNNTCNNGVVFGNVTYHATWIKLDNFRSWYFTKSGADGIQINNSWWFLTKRCLFDSNYNNIHIPDNAVTTTILIDGYTEISSALNIGFLSDGANAINDTFTFRNVSVENNANGGIHCLSPKTIVILDTCYFEINSNTINISGSSILYKHSMLFMENCINHTTSSGYTINLDYVRGIISKNQGFIASQIITTANTTIDFGEVNAISADDLLTAMRSYLGAIYGKVRRLSTGDLINYSAYGHIFEGHLKTTQPTLPTIEVLSASGVGATAVLSTKSTDTAGQIQLTWGSSGWLSGSQCKITFTKPYKNKPLVFLTAGSTKTGIQSKNCAVSTDSTTTYFTLNFASAETSGGLGYWNYWIVETD